jgi:hypothetical protein
MSFISQPYSFVSSNNQMSPPQVVPPGFMGYQCLESEGVCVAVSARTTYDQYFPLFDTISECQAQCGYAINYSGDLDVNTGPKKAPKSFSEE